MTPVLTVATGSVYFSKVPLPADGPDGPIIAAVSTLAVAILSALAAYLANKRERRRTLYSEATKAAVAWKEMLYRVRRRGEKGESALIERFHDLQDDLSYYEAWVGAESRYMRRSYDRLVSKVKNETEDLIRTAWATRPRVNPTETPPDEVHPDLTRHVEDFLRDVRSHLSPWPWRKLAMWWRNRLEEPAE